MNTDIHQKLISALNDAAQPVTDDWSFLLEQIGDARFVLIGEASHGTHEFYQTRIEITKQLIMKKGFMAVAIEGDWPDAYRINRYVQGKGHAADAEKSLDDFKRFPTWMWRNTAVLPFVKWLREYNDQATNKTGFYGLDLYSLNASMKAVVDYLEKVEPSAARDARNRYACFDHMSVDPQMYGYLTSTGVKKTCIDEVIGELCELQHRASKYLRQDGIVAEDEYFFAAQNARLVKNAEVYYRSMFEGQVSSWNIRDRHMAETLNILADHLEDRFKQPAKIIIWAHNSHVGDARATEMGERGEVNIGQLVREQHAHTYSIGFSTYEGFVSAANNWDTPATRITADAATLDLLEKLLEFNPTKRITAQDALQHPFIQPCFKSNDVLPFPLKPRSAADERSLNDYYQFETELDDESIQKSPTEITQLACELILNEIARYTPAPSPAATASSLITPNSFFPINPKTQSARTPSPKIIGNGFKLFSGAPHFWSDGNNQDTLRSNVVPYSFENAFKKIN